MLYNHLVSTKSLYIHWPFCPYRCHFCPFVALAGHDSFMHRYHAALKKEIILFADKCEKKEEIDTIFFGGGTPSTYPNDLLLDMFGTLKNRFIVTSNTEITIEVNPGTVTKDQLLFWKQIGINRLSIGVQSLNDKVLQKLNRLQTSESVYRLLDVASNLFDNISIDLILGLPGITDEEWKSLLQTVVTWKIKHLSMYFLTVHENTQLYFGVKKKKVTLPPDDSLVDLYIWSVNFLKQHGFEQYETSSFSRSSNYECSHNKVYWDRKPYKGFGLGAFSFDGTLRLQNNKNLMNYLDLVEKEEDICIFSEKLTKEQIYLEKIMLGLRRKSGLKISSLSSGLTKEKKEKLLHNIAWLKSNNFIYEKEGKLGLLPAGLTVQNEVFVKLSL